MIVLDASALLAFLFREPGHEEVAEVFTSSCLSTVNLAEVIGRFVRDGHAAAAVRDQLLASPIEVVSFTAADATRTAALLPHTQPLGLSLGDRACLALGLARDLPVLTADRAWTTLECGVTIRLIR